MFNYPGGRPQPLKYYTVKVPLRVQPGDEGSRAIEAQWLDHMTQHFNNGNSLVDGYFNLGKDDGENAFPLVPHRETHTYRHVYFIDLLNGNVQIKHAAQVHYKIT